MKKVWLVFLSVFFSMAHAALAENTNPPDYSIYIDAGSTGTRLHLYKYKTTPVSAPIIEEIPLDPANPNAGISTITLHSFADSANIVNNNLSKSIGEKLLKDLLDRAKKRLQNSDINNDPKHPITSVPVYLLGTAGMRSIADGTKADKIYAAAKSYVLTNYANIFDVLPKVPKSNNDNFANLEGSKEALFGWEAINYEAGNFQLDPKTNKPKETFGNIDFGGASLEIAFQTTNLNASNLGDAFKIGDIQYYVFILSFANLGQTKSLEAIIKKDNGNACFPIGSTTPLGKEGPTIVGSFIFDTCKGIYAKLTQDDELTKQINQIPPAKNLNFIAHSGVYRVFKFFKIDGPGTDSTLEIKGTFKVLEDGLKEKCGGKPSSTDISKLEKFCPNGVFLDYFIQRLGLIGSQLNATNMIKDKKIEWTLGAVLNGLIEHNNA
jgi:hypothetical protein